MSLSSATTSWSYLSQCLPQLLFLLSLQTGPSTSTKIRDTMASYMNTLTAATLVRPSNWADQTTMQFQASISTAATIHSTAPWPEFTFMMALIALVHWVHHAVAGASHHLPTTMLLAVSKSPMTLHALPKLLHYWGLWTLNVARAICSKGPFFYASTI
jgi:hypothetical protein